MIRMQKAGTVYNTELCRKSQGNLCIYRETTLGSSPILVRRLPRETPQMGNWRQRQVVDPEFRSLAGDKAGLPHEQPRRFRNASTGGLTTAGMTEDPLKTVARNLLALACLILACNATAQPYLVAGVGSESSLVAGAGYQANKYAGAELSYFRAEADGEPVNTGMLRATVPSETVKGFGLFAVGTLPIAGQVSLVAKIGAYRLEADNAPAETVAGVGLGAKLALSERWAGRVMLEHIESKGRIPNFDLVSAQITYSF